MSTEVDRALPPGKTGTRVILSRDDRSKLTANRTMDAFNALRHGLKEYLEQLSVSNDGVTMQMPVFSSWPEFEDKAAYPSALVVSTAPAQYDAHSFTPNISNGDKVGDGQFVLSLSELVQTLTIHVWANTSVERRVLGYMIEDAMSPVLWAYSLRLELPFYFNQRAEYELVSVTQLDDEVAAHRRIHKSVYEITARIPVTKIVSVPQARPLATVTAQESVLTP